MLRRNKTLSIVMTLCLCLAMLAPVFVAPQAADAAGVTYTTLTCPTVNTDTAAFQALGKVLVEVSDYRALPAYDAATSEYLTVALPSGLEFDRDANTPLTAVGTNCQVSATRVSSSTYQLAVKQVETNTDDDNAATILLSFAKVKVKTGSGNLDASFSGSNLFASGTATIAVKGSGGTNSSIGTKVIGDSGELKALTIDETMVGTLKAGTRIKLKLPAGFSWDADSENATISGLWGFSSLPAAAFDLTVDDNEGRILYLDMDAVGGDNGTNFTPSNSNTTAGRIRIEGLKISADDNAKYGDVEMNLSSSNNDDVTEQDLVVATYGTYGAKVVEGTQKDVVSGQNSQDIGTFNIEETVAASLLDNRTVYMELPEGVRWADLPVAEAIDGTNCFGTATMVSNTDQRKIKWTIDGNADSTTAVNIKFKSAEVYVEPGFEGPIAVTVSGGAGVEGTATVANCAKAITIATENAADVVIGQTNQKAADIVITEGADGAILDTDNHDKIILSLDNGVYFTSKPTVEVTEGDLEIDSYKLIDSSSALQITVKYASTKASKINISGVLLTLDRTVPEGAVTATLTKAVGDEDTTYTGSTALDEGYLKDLDDPDSLKLSETSAGKVVIANTITPAQAGGNAEFKINSNIYSVNGVAKVMDVAPYIKDNRTYVPIRYLAYALGVAENDVVWDAAASTATFTKGDKVVVLTIGSTTMTVNGEAQTMDVAPEIVNNRTMLPARFVAEAFGATVGWDAATGTVVIAN